MDDLKHIEATVRRCMRSAGPALVSAKLARTSAKGVASFDVYLTNGIEAYEAVDCLRSAFGAREAVLKASKRCETLPVSSVGRKKRAAVSAAPQRQAAGKKAA